MTLEEEAQQYINQNYDCYCPDTPHSFEEDIRQAYIAGATENMTVWYTVSPATSHFCISEHGAMVYWNASYQKWQDARGNFTDVKAWCEIPKFEED